MSHLDTKSIFAKFKILFSIFTLSAILLLLGQSPAFAANVTGTLIQTIITKSPPWPSSITSPDPSGIAYLSNKDTLLDCDGEVDEMPALFTGDNLFEISRDGVLSNTYSTTNLSRSGYSNEPVGCAFDPISGHLFISDDNQKRVYELSPDSDGNFTLNSPRTWFSAPSVCNIASIDAEGLAYGAGTLFIIDGVGAEVWKVLPGNDGIFGSTTGAATGETCTHFDTSGHVLDPEGGEYDPDTSPDNPGHLYVVGEPVNQLIDFTTAGTWVRTIDIGSLPKKPAGLAAVTKSKYMDTDGKTHMFIADRVVDNDSDPNENDGKIYEFSLPNLPTGNQAPTVSAGTDQMINASANAVLDGTVMDDGSFTTAWTQLSGPGTVTFDNANAVDTTASFSIGGVYVLRLTATDSQSLSSSDDVQITVQPDLPFAKIYISTGSSGTALNSNPSACGGVTSLAFGDEDILAYDLQSRCWSTYFDGSDVGLGGSGVNVDAFYLRADGSILLSLTTDGVIIPNNVGAIDDSDIVHFIPTSTGSTTAGTYEWYFNGADVELIDSAEDIDAIGFTPSGNLVVSTSGSPTVTGVSGALDEDLLIFTPTPTPDNPPGCTGLGENTCGTWALYFDGSDVELSQSSKEDVNGTWIDSNGDIYLTTLDAFSVTGASGGGDDIFRCVPASTGNTTACTYDFIWNGIGNGLPDGAVVDGMQLVRNPPGNSTPTLAITLPANGSTFTSGASITFIGTATDNEDGDKTDLISWTSSINGPIGNGGSFSTSTLSAGAHTITASVTDKGGLTGSASISVTINPAGNSAPTATISQPANNSTFASGALITFTGTATDNEDGDKTDLISWTSSINGPIGNGGSFSTSTLSAGTHTITASVTDKGGLTGSASISVTVNPSGGGINLTHQWKFDETSGTTALDSIVGTYNVTLSNSSWVAGKTGNAASFNGLNASGDAGKIDFGTGNFTVAHWVNVNGFKNYAGIFNNRSSATEKIGFLTRTDGISTITALIDFGATSKNLAVTNAVTGTWYHVAVSVDRAGLMKLYVNGVLAGQVSISTFSGTSITNTDNVRIGRDQSSNYFNGVVDDLRIYNGVLSDTDIKSICHAVDATLC